jgi:hypothetical protein
MSSSLFSKIAFSVFVALLIFGIISAFTVIDREQLKNKFEDNPKATGFGFFLFSQGYSSNTPYWELFDGKIQIPYPDSTDIFGLFIFSILALLVIYIFGLQDNYAIAFLLFIVFMICGWFIWKIFMYYMFIFGGESIGLTYQQIVQLKIDANSRIEKIGLPLLILSIFTFFAGLKLLPTPK